MLCPGPADGAEEGAEQSPLFQPMCPTLAGPAMDPAGPAMDPGWQAVCEALQDQGEPSVFEMLSPGSYPWTFNPPVNPRWSQPWVDYDPWRPLAMAALQPHWEIIRGHLGQQEGSTAGTKSITVFEAQPQ